MPNSLAKHNNGEYLMFIFKSKYRDLQRQHEKLSTSYDYKCNQVSSLLQELTNEKLRNVDLNRENRNLMLAVHRLESTLFEIRKFNTIGPFDKEEINELIHLCHPDKHNGKPLAQKLTQKLLRLR